jgi:hypothetical protein
MIERLQSTKVLPYQESQTSIAADDIGLLALLLNLASCCCMHTQQQLR